MIQGCLELMSVTNTERKEGQKEEKSEQANMMSLHLFINSSKVTHCVPPYQGQS